MGRPKKDRGKPPPDPGDGKDTGEASGEGSATPPVVDDDVFKTPYHDPMRTTPAATDGEDAFTEDGTGVKEKESDQVSQSVGAAAGFNRVLLGFPCSLDKEKQVEAIRIERARRLESALQSTAAFLNGLMLCVEAKAISESTLRKAEMEVKERTARLNKASMERGDPSWQEITTVRTLQRDMQKALEELRWARVEVVPRLDR